MYREARIQHLKKVKGAFKAIGFFFFCNFNFDLEDSVSKSKTRRGQESKFSDCNQENAGTNVKICKGLMGGVNTEFFHKLISEGIG